MMANKPKEIISLEDKINAKIAESVIATMPTDDLAVNIKARLMQRVESNSHAFVFANQGDWKTVAAGVEVKLLHSAGEAKSFIIKMAANASIAAHVHSLDEESFVLNGEVWLEGILCHAGDYHFAQAGSGHQQIRTETGCTLLVKTI